MLKKLWIGICASILCFTLQAQNDDIMFFTPELNFEVSKISYQWVSYRAKLSIETNEQDISCQLFVVNKIDSILYINLSIIGIELARAVLTPVKMTFVNKMEKNYYQGDYGYIQTFAGIPFDFNILQSLLNGVLEETFDQSFTIEYGNYTTIEDTPFFQKFRFESNEVEVNAELKNIKFNIPGPTDITIPEGFKMIGN